MKSFVRFLIFVLEWTWLMLVAPEQQEEHQQDVSPHVIRAFSSDF